MKNNAIQAFLLCFFCGFGSAAFGQGIAVPADIVAAWTPPKYLPPEHTVSASVLGLNPSESTDVTAAFQKALDTLKPGQTLLLDAGTYRISKTIFINGGTNLMGPQDANNHPTATILQTKGLGQWKALNLGILMNRNYQADAALDADITVTAVGFQALESEGTGILFRAVKNTSVRGCRFNRGGDGTAFLASSNTLVSDSLATNTTNAAFDHWDGNMNSRVVNSIASLAGGYGILFNAMDTDKTPRVAADFTALNNHIYGSSLEYAAIWVEPLDAASSITGTITIKGNTVAGFNGDPNSRANKGRKTGAASGILVGNTNAAAVYIENNRVSGTVNGSAISISAADRSRRPHLGVISGNSLFGNTGAMEMQAMADTAVVVNNLSHGGSFPLFVWAPSPELYFYGNTFTDFQPKYLHQLLENNGTIVHGNPWIPSSQKRGTAVAEETGLDY